MGSKPNTPVPAGDFSQWLRGAVASIETGDDATSVPCGGCTACCRASMFIHIEPDETATIRSIPRPLLFAAPGRPKGHLLMGYNDQGHCPMLVNDKCSIYEHRPRTCRAYDCRVFAATGIEAETQAEIDSRVQRWVFQYEDEAARHEQEELIAAADFLISNRERFPQGTLPTQPAQMAALAVRIFRTFRQAREQEMERPSDSAVAEAILTTLNSDAETNP